MLQLETANFDLSEECRHLKHQLEQAKSNYDDTLADVSNQYKQTVARLVKENNYLQEMIEQQERSISTTNLKLVNEQAMNQQYEKELATLKQMIQQEKTRASFERDNLRTSIELLSTENKKLVEKVNKMKAELKLRDKKDAAPQAKNFLVDSPLPKPAKRRPNTPKKIVVKKELAVVKSEVSSSCT